MSDEADQEVPTRRTRGAGPADLADTEKSADDPALAHTALAELPIGANREVSLVPTAPRTQLTREQPGRYVPGRELGRGGMGRVGLVFDTVLGREVALKELLGGERVAADGLSIGVVTRFLREARITGQLEHPGIVPVYELGQRDDGTLYYTMKAIRGRSLAAELREAREPADRLALMGRFRDVCEAVAYAHSRGVVHRDLKPDNVMVGEFGETLVVDWGIAKVRGEDETRPPSEHDTRSSARPLALLEGSVGTLAGHAIGTPAYMSPEQARGELASIDERSDVWGLGAILFEILTGRAPFTGQNAREVLHRVLEESPPRVRTIAPDAPPELAAIADRALSRDPTSRYPGAREVAAEIAAWQEDGQVRAYEYSTIELARRFVRRHRAASVAALVITLAVVGASIVSARSYVSEQRARRAAEAERDTAREERARAIAGERATQVAIAEALLARAERALDDGDPAGASVLAAGALVSDPYVGHRASAALSELTVDERTAAREREARARSAYADGDERQLFTLERTLRGGALGSFLSAERDALLFVSGERIVRITLSSGERSELAAPGVRSLVGVLDAARVAVRTSEGAEVRELSSGAVLERLDASLTAIDASAGLVARAHDDGRIELVPASGGVVQVSTPLRGELRVRASEGGAVAWARGGHRVVHVTLSGDMRSRTFAGRVTAAEPSPGGRVIAVGGSALEVALFGEEERHLAAHGYVTSLAWLDDARLVHLQAPDPVVRDVASGDVLDTLHLPASGARRLFLARGGRVVVVEQLGSDASPVMSSYTQVSSSAWRRLDLGSVVDEAALDPRGETLFVASGGALRRVDLRQRALSLEATSSPLPFDDPAVSGLAASADHSVALLTSRGGVALIPREGEARILLPEARTGSSFPGLGIALAEEGDLVIAGMPDGTIERVHQSGERLRALTGHRGAVYSLAVSPDGARFASASADRTVRIWRTASGDVDHTIGDHAELAGAVAFSPSGTRLATGDGEGWVRIVRVSDGAVLHRVRAARDWINRIAWSPDGRHLVIASDDLAVRVLDAETLEPLRIARLRSTGLVALITQSGDLVHADGSVLTRLPAVRGDLPRDPEALLERAEQRAGVRLERLTLVPVE